MLLNIWRDIRYTLRTLRLNPGFAVAAAAPIALGIGINTGVFTILYNLAMRPHPVPGARELVSVHQEFQGVKGRQVHGARMMFSAPEYRIYRDSTKTLSGITAYSSEWTVTIGDRFPREVEGDLVACNYFDVLQVRPAIGTGFTAAHCEPNNPVPAVVLSHALWTHVLGADPDIVRQTITLNGQAVAVAGVAPEGFEGIGLTKAAFFAPLTLQPLFHPERNFLDDPQMSWLTLIGRRVQDLRQVRAELAVIAGQIDGMQPGRRTSLIVEPANALALPVARRGFLGMAAIAMAAFSLVLLIACANVANVLLARAANRTKEIAIRLSVGARRGRLIQQLLIESLIIAIAGGIAGPVLAWWSFRTLLSPLLATLPGSISLIRMDAQPNLIALGFASGLTIVTALVCGMAPALRASRQDLHTVMKRDSADATSWSGGILRGSLITIQIAVCMVLLVAAGLLTRGLHAVQTVNPGFDYRNVTMVSFDMRGPGYTDVKVAAFRQQAVERFRALPGVTVAEAGKMPWSPGRMVSTFRLPDRNDTFEVDVNAVSAEFFGVIGIPIVRGRTFTAAEIAGTSRAAIVTEATARRYWPGRDPIGRSIFMGGSSAERVEIVGVARDAQISHASETASSYMYFPANQPAQRRLGLLVRSDTEFAALARSIQTVSRELDAGLMPRVSPLEANLEIWRTGSRVIAGVSGSLGLLALVLASVGVYGVVSYVVTRRRREVGIRMTLGATAGDVRWLILRQTLRPVAAGLALGAAGAAASSQLLKTLLFGISPFDPVAFIAAALFLLGVATMAGVLPMRRALKVDPMVALRYE
jgi:macrolide transport system ATP-binding/permease protein